LMLTGILPDLPLFKTQFQALTPETKGLLHLSHCSIFKDRRGYRLPQSSETPRDV
jgi:hypothetical protein